MSIRIEKDGPIWTVIHSRPEARNAMGPESTKALFEAFQSFDADEALQIGLSEYVVPEGYAPAKAEALAHEIARFPQSCVRADGHSVRFQHGLSMQQALRQEWCGSKTEISKGVEGAARFASGKGRGGDFSDV